MEEKFYNFALRFLSYRPRSEKEVRNKLKIKSEKLKIEDSTAIIDRVIQKLKEYKFLDDVEFAKKWIESRLRFKPRSARLIKMELKQKGIEQDLIDNLINDLRFTINDLENAQKLISKKLSRYRDLPKEKIYQKLGRYLASKGFDWDTIKKSIDEMLDKGV